MKKTATLLAGLLLVSGTIFGASVELKHTKLEGTYNFVDTIDGPFTSDTQNDWDANVRFFLEANVDLKDYGVLTVDLDVTKVESERELSLIYKRSYGDFEGNIAAKMIGYKTVTETIKDNTGATTGSSTYGKTDFTLEPSLDDENTYIKYNIFGNKDYSLTYYPWYMEIKFDTDWVADSFEGYNGPGIKLDKKIGDNSKISLEMTTLTGSDSTIADYKEKNQYAYAITGDTKINKTYITAFVGTSDVGKLSNGVRDGKKELDVAFRVKTNLTDKAYLINMFDWNKYEGREENGIQAFARLDYTLDKKYKNFKLIPYSSILYKNQAAVGSYTDITYNGTTHTYADTSACGDLKELEAGLKFEQGNFSITPKARFTMREKAAYVKYNDEENLVSKYNFTAGVTFAHEVWR